jgi:CHAD domain-containing protein
MMMLSIDTSSSHFTPNFRISEQEAVFSLEWGMPSLELSLLLHRALEARVTWLCGLLAPPDWAADPERLHQVRVASRRVRAVLDLVRPEVYPGHDRQCRRLRRLTRALGLTREMDVHALYLERLAPSVPGLVVGAALEHVLEALDRGRARARRRMGTRLEGHPLRKLPEILVVPSLPDPFLPGDLDREVRQALEPALRAALSPLPGLLEGEDVEALHRVRIRVKRFRYALEILGEALPARPEAELQGLRDLQTALGDHHDRATLEAFLRSLYGGLEARGRSRLASGILELTAYVEEARMAAFGAVRAAAPAVGAEDLVARLWPGGRP